MCVFSVKVGIAGLGVVHAASQFRNTEYEIHSGLCELVTMASAPTSRKQWQNTECKIPYLDIISYAMPTSMGGHGSPSKTITSQIRLVFLSLLSHAAKPTRYLSVLLLLFFSSDLLIITKFSSLHNIP